MATGHGGEKKIRYLVNEKYQNISQKMIAAFVSNCETCQKKKTKPNKGLVVRPLKSKDVFDRGQVDLIVMESTPDRGFKYILNYQDHFSKFNVLRPMQSKTAAEVAHNLIDIFCLLSPPAILQSDNGREFVAKVIEEMKTIWPELRIVHGTPRHPQSQGSIERSNDDIKQMLIAWTIDNQTSQWAEGLRFVMFQKNSSPHRNLENQTPLSVLFGKKGSSGMARTQLPKDIIDKLEKEEDLLQSLADMARGDSDDEGQDKENHIDAGTDAERRNFEQAQRHALNISTEQRETQSEERKTQREMTEREREILEEDEINIINEVQETQRERENTSLGDNVETQGETTDMTVIESLDEESIFLELERAVMHVSEEEEENGAVGDAVCSSHTTPVEKNDAVSVHLSRVEQCRDQARLGQEKSRAEMLRTTRQKLQPLLEGEAVLIPISEFDRGRLDCRNVPGVVLEAKNDLYKIGTEHGLLSSRLSRNQIIKADFQIISRQNVKTDITLPFRRIAALHSRFGGQGFTKCSCKGLCSTKRCQCLKSKTKCHSHCHPHKTCTNK